MWCWGLNPELPLAKPLLGTLSHLPLPPSFPTSVPLIFEEKVPTAAFTPDTKNADNVSPVCGFSHPPGSPGAQEMVSESTVL